MCQRCFQRNFIFLEFVQKLFCFWQFFFKEVTRSAKTVLLVFPGNFKGVSRVIKEVARAFYANFKEVSNQCFKGVSCKFQGCFQSVSKVF